MSLRAKAVQITTLQLDTPQGYMYTGEPSFRGHSSRPLLFALCGHEASETSSFVELLCPTGIDGKRYWAKRDLQPIIDHLLRLKTRTIQIVVCSIDSSVS